MLICSNNLSFMIFAYSLGHRLDRAARVLLGVLNGKTPAISKIFANTLHLPTNSTASKVTATTMNTKSTTTPPSRIQLSAMIKSAVKSDGIATVTTPATQKTPRTPIITTRTAATGTAATTTAATSTAATTTAATTATPTSAALTVSRQSSLLIAVGWHRSNFLDFFDEHKIRFHPDWSWKAFISTVAQFIIKNTQDEVLFSDWTKIHGGGETLMLIKLSSPAACSRGFDILCKSKGFASCHVELRCC
ncbi:hypothetical protein C7212DRAFT_345384 [Tuber magnatum]|uniref:Uncharacterized protein n=1 Tax=Tuber magnatum TaxID=42249 RepID=A0A317SLQ9_9PEZI|nr:hypothetical protein C7212DRAFT_345384 [Tuber magnatum]